MREPVERHRPASRRAHRRWGNGRASRDGVQYRPPL